MKQQQGQQQPQQVAGSSPQYALGSRKQRFTDSVSPCCFSCRRFERNRSLAYHMLVHLADMLGPSEAGRQLTSRFHTPVDSKAAEEGAMKHETVEKVST